MKKLSLVIATLSLLLLATMAEAKGGRKTFSAKAEGVAAPQLIAGPAIESVTGFPAQNHVDLWVVVEKEGRVTSYGPVGRWDDPALVTSAEKVVENEWRFTPATMTWQGGAITPVRVRMVVRVPIN